MRTAILVLLGVVGCATPLRPTFRIDADQTTATSAAVTQWLDAAPSLSLSSSGGTIRVVQGDPGLGFAAMTTIVGRDAEIVVRPEFANDEAVIAHEIGHALGLPHAPDGLMKNAPLVDERVTCREVAAFCEIWSDGEPCECGLTSSKQR